MVCQSGEVGISELTDICAPRSTSLSARICCEGLSAERINAPCIDVNDSGRYLAASTGGKLRVNGCRTAILIK